MKRSFKKVRLLLLASAIGALPIGCFFGGSLNVTLFGNIVTIEVDLGGEGVQLGACFELVGSPGNFSCEIQGITSAFETLTFPELVLTLVLLDPVVVQLPDDITNFSGTFSRNGGAAEPLAITAGLSSVPIDADLSLTAEADTQLVIIGLPLGTPTTGSGFAFSVSFEVPPGTMEIQAKPIITGFVELVDGSVFYPPVLPCVDDMAAAPVLTVPLPAPGGTVLLPPLTGLGCNSASYNLIPDWHIFRDGFENTP